MDAVDALLERLEEPFDIADAQPKQRSAWSLTVILRDRTRPREGESSLGFEGHSPTLAHRGVLLLDELPEFPRSVLEALRLPLVVGGGSTGAA